MAREIFERNVPSLESNLITNKDSTSENVFCDFIQKDSGNKAQFYQIDLCQFMITKLISTYEYNCGSQCDCEQCNCGSQCGSQCSCEQCNCGSQCHQCNLNSYF